MDISAKLKQLRHEKGLTQKELADNTGLSYAAIAAYEKALRSPNAKAMAALEQFFGVTAAELLSSNGKPPLKAIVRRVKKNPPKPTSTGKDKIDFLAECLNRASEHLSEIHIQFRH